MKYQKRAYTSNRASVSTRWIPIYTQRSPVHTHKKSMYAQKSPIYTQKSPIYAQNSPICTQKNREYHLWQCQILSSHKTETVTHISESFCNSDMCRPWLVSVTLGIGYYLVNWEIFEALLLRYFPRLYQNQKIEKMGLQGIMWAVGRPTKCERPCAKRGIRAW